MEGQSGSAMASLGIGVGDEQSLRAWLMLHRASGFGACPSWQPALAAVGGDPVVLLDCGMQEWLRLGLSAKVVRRLRNATDDLPDTLQWLESPNRGIVHFAHPRYPYLLKQIDSPPPLLFVCGDSACLSSPQIAIVGSRKPSAGANRNAYTFASALTECGLTVTSGLAVGIDTQAHRGALAAGGTTIAVAATGPELVYPASNRDLATEIVAKGAIVTEFPPGTPVQRWQFPRRNRLISGLGVGVLVVEAGLRSGSLTTARHAMAQGRGVFAVPGSINNPLTRGCHQLIRDGAALVEQVGDIVSEIGTLVDVTLSAIAVDEDHSTANLDEASTRLLDAMGFDPVAPDELIQRIGLTPQTLSSMLLALELEGYVTAEPGGRYLRIH